MNSIANLFGTGMDSMVVILMPLAQTLVQLF
jgi:hypothetical protein